MRPWRRRGRDAHQLRFVALAQPSMSVRVTAAARVPVVAATPVERKVDAPPIDAPPMLVDLDEVVRLRKENAALQADLAVKADLLDEVDAHDGDEPRADAAAPRPAADERGEGGADQAGAGGARRVAARPVHRRRDAGQHAAGAGGGGRRHGGGVRGGHVGVRSLDCAGGGRRADADANADAGAGAAGAVGAGDDCAGAIGANGAGGYAAAAASSREVQGALPEAAPEQSCHAAVGLPVLLRRWRAEPVRPAVRGTEACAAGAAGAADCRCSAAAGAGADGAAAGRGCSRASLPAAAAPLSALDREAFAIMY